MCPGQWGSIDLGQLHLTVYDSSSRLSQRDMVGYSIPYWIEDADVEKRGDAIYGPFPCMECQTDSEFPFSFRLLRYPAENIDVELVMAV